jgi:hypothetical protein
MCSHTPKRLLKGWTLTVTLGEHALGDGTIAPVVKVRARQTELDAKDISGCSVDAPKL